MDTDFSIYLRIPILITQLFCFSLKQQIAFGENISIFYDQANLIFQIFREMVLDQYNQFIHIFGKHPLLETIFFHHLFNLLGLP